MEAGQEEAGSSSSPFSPLVSTLRRHTPNPASPMSGSQEEEGGGTSTSRRSQSPNGRRGHRDSLTFGGLPPEDLDAFDHLAKAKAKTDRQKSLRFVVDAAIKAPELFGVGPEAALPGGVAGIGSATRNIFPAAQGQQSMRNILASKGSLKGTFKTGVTSVIAGLRFPLPQSKPGEEEEEEDEEVGKKRRGLPGGLTNEIWNSDLFKKALVREAVAMEELLLPENVQDQLDKIDSLLADERISPEEHEAKCKGFTGATKENARDAVERMKQKRDGIVKCLHRTMQEITREESKELPCPCGVSNSMFRGKYFAMACAEMNLTLKDLVKPERLKLEWDRINRLFSEERIDEKQYIKKCRLVTGTVPELADQVLDKITQANDEMIKRLVKLTPEIHKREEREKKEKEAVARRKREMIQKMHEDIEKRLEKEETKSRLLLARRKFQLENMLIQKGVAVKLQILEEVDENTTKKAHRLKKEPTWFHVPLVTKTRAAKERKNLYLRQKSHNPDLLNFYIPKGAANAVKQDASLDEASRTFSSPEDRVLNLRRELKERARQSKERHQRMFEEKRTASIEAQKQKQMRADQKKQEMDETRRQHLEALRLQKTDKETIQARLQTQFASKQKFIQSRLDQVDGRIAALKAFRWEQKRHVDEIHARTRVQEDAIREFMFRIESGENLNTEMANELGIDVDQERVNFHVGEMTKQLTQPPNKITIPEIDARGMFEPDSGWLDFSLARERPQSALDKNYDHSEYEVEGDSSGKATRRPATAVKAERNRPKNNELDEWTRQALEALDEVRRDQQRALLHIVREERAREDERARMMEAVLPHRRKTLRALLDEERREASERIQRVAAENEMQMMHEMAKIGAER